MRQRVARFEQPMVSVEFGYSPLGAMAAASLALAVVATLYAFTQWPLETAGWLAAVGVARVVGRHPIATLFR